MRSIRTCLAVTALVAMSACGGIGPDAPSLTTPTQRTLVLDGKTMHRCGLYGLARCGRLKVPEDRSDPSGRRIGLDVMVIPAADPEPEPDPVFFLAGGPGGAATRIWWNAADVFPRVHDHRDIVLVDQRGTGDSNPLLLPEFPDTTGMPAREARAAIARSVERGLERLDTDPRLYASAAAADDLDDVRAALGYDRIDLYGASYGATLAQYYVRRHERHVRAVVLDGGTLLDVPLFELLPANSQRILDTVFDRCAADAACHAAFPDPAGDLATAIARLTRHPVQTDVSASGSDAPVVADAHALVDEIHHLLAVGDGAGVPLLIHQAATGDLEPVAEHMLGTGTDLAGSTERMVMFWSIVCSEGWARFDPARTAELGAGSYLLGSELERARGIAAVCRAMPEPALGPGDAAPLRSNVPVLFLNGAADPQDPPSNVADAPVQLPNSLVVAIPGLGHTVGHLECCPDVIGAFFEAGSVDGLDTSQIERLAPAPFETS